MKITIKRFDTTLPLPSYQTDGAACVDLCARVDTTIPAHSIGYIPLNIALEMPLGYWVLLAARSSTHKSGIMQANGIGIMDWDYRGDNDEYHFAAYNFTDSEVTIERGQRIAQILIMKLERMEFEEVVTLEGIDRGNFGSTG